MVLKCGSKCPVNIPKSPYAVRDGVSRALIDNEVKKIIKIEIKESHIE